MKRSALTLVLLPVFLAGAPARAQQPARPVVVHVEPGGFRWIDAAIGGAAVAGVAAAAAGFYSYRRTTKEDR